MQILNKESGEISEIQFEFYELDLTPYYEQGIKDIYPDEMSTEELLLKLKNKNYGPEEFGTLQNRFINPIYIFIFSILPLLTFKMVRKPDSKWTLPIIIISFTALFVKFFEILNYYSKNFDKKNEIVELASRFHLFGVVLARFFLPQLSIMDFKSCAKECIV